VIAPPRRGECALGSVALRDSDEVCRGALGAGSAGLMR
jgi:hypothetical protein